MKFPLCALLVVSILAGCSGASSSSRVSASGSPGVATLAFVLPEGAQLLSSTSVSTSDYVGHDDLVSSPQSLDALSAWLSAVKAKPPGGYTLEDAGRLSRMRNQLAPYGIDALAFTHTVGGKPHGTVVLVYDPAIVRDKAGIVVSLASKYRALPPMLRDPLDVQIKKSTGMTGTELLDPSNPLGAVIGSLNSLTAANQRGILIVDGSKK